MGSSGGHRKIPGGSDDFSWQNCIIIYISSSPSSPWSISIIQPRRPLLWLLGQDTISHHHHRGCHNPQFDYYPTQDREAGIGQKIKINLNQHHQHHHHHHGCHYHPTQDKEAGQGQQQKINLDRGFDHSDQILSRHSTINATQRQRTQHKQLINTGLCFSRWGTTKTKISVFK